MPSFAEELVSTINSRRSAGGVGLLSIDGSLMSRAQNYAEKLAREQRMEHSQSMSEGIGENLFSSFGTAVNGTNAALSWLNEEKDYNFNNGGFSSETGHFTQCVWKDSQVIFILKFLKLFSLKENRGRSSHWLKRVDLRCCEFCALRKRWWTICSKCIPC